MNYYLISDDDIKRIKDGTMNIDSVAGCIDNLVIASITGGDIVSRFDIDPIDDTQDYTKLIKFIKQKCDETCDIDADVWQFIEDMAILYNEGR